MTLSIEGGNAHSALESARRWMKSDDRTLYRELYNRLQLEILTGGARMTAEDVRLFRRAVDHYGPVLEILVSENLIAACNSRDHALASLDLMELAFRLEDRRRSSGSYPATLEDLGAIPVDPFSGQPYAYRLTANGSILYSFGMDRDDDGGEPHPIGGIGGWDQYQGDLVWTLDSRGL